MCTSRGNARRRLESFRTEQWTSPHHAVVSALCRVPCRMVGIYEQCFSLTSNAGAVDVRTREVVRETPCPRLSSVPLCMCGGSGVGRMDESVPQISGEMWPLCEPRISL